MPNDTRVKSPYFLSSFLQLSQQAGASARYFWRAHPFYHIFFACATNCGLHTTGKTGTIELQLI
ncbi:hypothetical protein NE588_15875, partial [Faecalibacterium prausnitzii]|uniref:hypothetical protein n=1 Tax=Faecalibacterium prausnitzii TaxID=853 RepID=UPI00210DF6B7